MHRNHPPFIRRKPKRRTAPADNPYEAHDQALLCQYMDAKRILYFAVPNDGERSYAMSQKAAATGLKAGVPDLCIPQPRAPYHGLYIELKRKRGGVVSESQQWWIDALRGQSYRAEVCCGYDAAVKVLEDYFK